MKTVTAIFGTVLVTVATVATATPFEKYPNYLDSTNVDRKVIHECLNPPKPRALKRREIANTGAAHGPAGNELIYEPQEPQARDLADNELVYEPQELQDRGLIDNVMAAGKKLFLAEKPLCTAPGVPDNFLFVNEIMDKAVDWCQRIRTELDISNFAERGVTGLVADTLPFGHDKQGHQLKDKVNVGLQLAVTLAPPPVGQAFEITKSIVKGISDLCPAGVERLLQEKNGCTQAIKYYRPSKAKHYTDAAARSGEVPLYWNDTDIAIGRLALDIYG
ncbi:hypothetical protein CC80DRAFT_547300 [Byssothecium circinans]|uniref:Uncharacterized protein n=1 Tax=Byssothecium circinans TaxID=147558 RepID=A0A6A5TXM1_9PLEO|nr:hypothetical protein CC80DRAFT_547300 [Byssothecium circinans]